MICIPHQILFGAQVKEDQMGWARGTYGGEEKCMQVLVGKSEGKNRLEDLELDGRT
jgi:hypothetical protein